MSDLGLLRGVPLTKGHGTESDVLLLTDPDAMLELDAAAVAAVCDRHTGIGAEGLVRALRSTAVAGADGAAEWFMDHRGADGSRVEVCGTAVRVFAAYLEHEGLIDLSAGAPVMIATRAGALTVWRTGELYTVDMGRWQLPGGQTAVARGHDVAVQVAGLDGARAGLRVALPAPHTVVALPDLAELAAADLRPPVAVDPPAEHGTDIELVVPLGETTIDGETAGTVRMRAQERGVGETRSCGTGACAAAIALHAWGGAAAPSLWRVLVPGGEVLVRLTDDGRAQLTGAAVLLADVTLR